MRRITPFAAFLAAVIGITALGATALAARGGPVGPLTAYASQTLGSTYAIWWKGGHQHFWRIRSNAGMVIVKDIGRSIVGIDGPTYTLIART